MSEPEPVPMRPLPLPDTLSAPFWAAAREGRLAIQRCTRCSRWNHAPAQMCPACGSEALTFEDVSGRATLFSWSVLHEAPAPGFRDMLPLTVAIVELAEQEHLLLSTSIVGAAPGSLRLGMPLRVTFEQVTAEVALPHFQPAGD